MTRTMEIPTYPASTSRARYKDDATESCVRVYAPLEAAGKQGHPRAIDPRYNDKIVCSKAFLRAPGAELRNAPWSNTWARARRKIRRLHARALQTDHRSSRTRGEIG